MEPRVAVLKPHSSPVKIRFTPAHRDTSHTETQVHDVQLVQHASATPIGSARPKYALHLQPTKRKDDLWKWTLLEWLSGLTSLTTCAAADDNCSVTCRRRKIKCDEQQPQCAAGVKGNRECVPLVGLVLRHPQNASINGTKAHGASSLRGFFANKNTVDGDGVWVELPSRSINLFAPCT